MEIKKKKILIVEDEAVVRESVRDWLVEDGYDVECVATGEKALERIKEQEFGVVVLDLRLPGIDGLQVYEHVKELTPETKGVIITAYPSKETLEKAKRLGLLDYKCGSCAFAQDIQDRFGTIAVIGEDEVAKLKQLPGSQRLCRYASVHFIPKEKPGLG